MAKRYRKKRHGGKHKNNMSYVRSFIGKGKRRGSRRRVKRGVRRITQQYGVI